MKSMLYVGAALMIGASIYGFVDYRETSHKKEFNELYEHKKTAKPEVTEKKTVAPTEKKEGTEKKEMTTVITKEEKKVTEKPVVKKKKKKKFNYREFSRAPLREEEELPVVEKKKEQ